MKNPKHNKGGVECKCGRCNKYREWLKKIKNNMRVYISGAISERDKESVKKEFNAAENYLKKNGHLVVNPINLQSKSWVKNISRDIILISRCDAIFMLDSWYKSYGSQIERLTALKLNKKILTTNQVQSYGNQIN